MGTLNSLRCDQRGQVLPIVALSLTVLFGFAAFAVDAGYLQYQQRRQQTAADGAAIAGAWQLLDGQTSTQITSAAQASAKTNGFTHDGTTVIVTVNRPPATGPNQGNKSAVEALVKVSHPAFFSSVLGRSKNDVTTRAVAVVQSNTAQACMVVTQKDLTMSSGVSINGGCGILVNRNVNDNNATINVPYIGAGGSAGKAISGVITTGGIPPFPDPCATIPGCRALTAMFPLGSTPGPGPFSSCTTGAPTSGSSIGPGCYGSFNGTYNLAPGLYVITGDVSSSGLTCTTCGAGSGVTIVVGGKINLNGSTTNLTAPPLATGAASATVTDSAGAPGVVLYQTSTATNPENFSAQSLLGMIYAPNAHIDLNGGGSTLTLTYVVAADIIANNSIITIANSGLRYLSQIPVLSE